MNNKVIMIDFDNTLSATGKWVNGPITARPVLGAQDAIRKLTEQGFTCVVFTARKDLGEVMKWLDHHLFTAMEVTNTKEPALAYIDDRGIRFTSWEDIVRYFI